ncbi:RHS repeat-associated core domain-containing protein [Dactylosporangium sp. NPDC005555]|uniref:RHS repeat protein n=1 Tax=Dactylosporangium sp. NPDC005555 TaxID=3154889 RepID=UPI0033AED67F
MVKGCRALAFTYATATTATGTAMNQLGDFAGRVSQISFTAYDPARSVMATTVVARYTYDTTGRLRQTWDPRLDYLSNGLTLHVTTGYTYNGDGVMDSYTPAAQEPWQFVYTSLPTDTGKGRLAQVRRSALTAGTAVTSVVYKVPVSGAGAPYDLSGVATLSWGQSEAPVDATAVFGPMQQPNGNQATGVMPTSYERAAITYLDGDGKAVNTAAPGGLVTTTWYDNYGNTVRTLDAANRETALQLSTVVAEQAAAAVKLSSFNTYSTDGQRLLSTLGPEHDLTLPDGNTVRGRAHAVNTFDEGAPNAGGPYNLITTAATSAQYTNTGGATVDGDTRVVKTAYNWTLRKTTVTTRDAGGLGLTDRTTYDESTGLVLTTTKPSGTRYTVTAATLATVYYRAGTGSGADECDNHPEWANLVCRTQPGGQTSGPELPVTVTTYDMYNQPTKTVQKISTGVLRTVVTAYDQAGRVITNSISAGAELGTAVPTTRKVYDPASTQLTSTEILDSNGFTTATNSSTYDTLGRVITYQDADSNVTTTTYDLLSRPLTVTDRLATRTMTYDGGTERRGLLTQVVDSQAGTFTAEYDANSHVVRENWPNGIVVQQGYDATGTQTGIAYVKTGCGLADCTVYADYTGDNVHGQQRWNNSTLSSQTYAYDGASRLTTVVDTAAGQCTIRANGFDSNSNRTVVNTFLPKADGSCNWSTQSSSRSWAYDWADRVNMPTYTYDALSRTTTTPAGDTQTSGDGNVLTTFHTNDMVRSISQGNRTTTYTLDVDNQRIRSWTETNTGTTTTRINHYGGSSDSPTWTTNGGSDYTRPLTSVNGLAAIYNGAAARVDWQITNLDGDVVATMSGDATALSATSETDEYGQLRNTMAGSQRYGWLGEHQRAADTPSGIVLMGVRLYNPATGRFLQADPVTGGSCTDYEYGCGDPVNNTDLDGRKCAKGLGWACATGKWVVKNRGTVATIAATATCLVPAIGWAACAGAQAAAYGIRAQQRIQKDGWRGSARENVRDGVWTAATLGIGQSLRLAKFTSINKWWGTGPVLRGYTQAGWHAKVYENAAKLPNYANLAWQNRGRYKRYL